MHDESRAGAGLLLAPHRQTIWHVRHTPNGCICRACRGGRSARRGGAVECLNFVGVQQPLAADVAPGGLWPPSSFFQGVLLMSYPTRRWGERWPNVSDEMWE
jgi:hypothetical protein